MAPPVDVQVVVATRRRWPHPLLTLGLLWAHGLHCAAGASMVEWHISLAPVVENCDSVCQGLGLLCTEDCWPADETGLQAINRQPGLVDICWVIAQGSAQPWHPAKDPENTLCYWDSGLPSGAVRCPQVPEPPGADLAEGQLTRRFCPCVNASAAAPWDCALGSAPTALPPSRGGGTTAAPSTTLAASLRPGCATLCVEGFSGIDSDLNGGYGPVVSEQGALLSWSRQGGATYDSTLELAQLPLGRWRFQEVLTGGTEIPLAEAVELTELSGRPPSQLSFQQLPDGDVYEALFYCCGAMPTRNAVAPSEGGPVGTVVLVVLGSVAVFAVLGTLAYLRCRRHAVDVPLMRKPSSGNGRLGRVGDAVKDKLRHNGADRRERFHHFENAEDSQPTELIITSHPLPGGAIASAGGRGSSSSLGGAPPGSYGLPPPRHVDQDQEFQRAGPSSLMSAGLPRSFAPGDDGFAAPEMAQRPPGSYDSPPPQAHSASPQRGGSTRPFADAAAAAAAMSPPPQRRYRGGGGLGSDAAFAGDADMAAAPAYAGSPEERSAAAVAAAMGGFGGAGPAVQEGPVTPWWKGGGTDGTGEASAELSAVGPLMEVGTEVRLRGLADSWNGAEATIEDFNRSTGVVHVRLPDGRVKTVHRRNLEAPNSPQRVRGFGASSPPPVPLGKSYVENGTDRHGLHASPARQPHAAGQLRGLAQGLPEPPIPPATGDEGGGVWPAAGRSPGPGPPPLPKLPGELQGRATGRHGPLQLPALPGRPAVGTGLPVSPGNRYSGAASGSAAAAAEDPTRSLLGDDDLASAHNSMQAHLNTLKSRLGTVPFA